MSKRAKKKPALEQINFKLGVAIILDLIDFTIGRMFGFGMLFDVLMVFVAYVMFGPIGLAAAWEMIEPTDQLDGFVPTFTLLALADRGLFKR